MAANQEETWGTGDNSGFGLSWWLGTVPGRVVGMAQDPHRAVLDLLFGSQRLRSSSNRWSVSSLVSKVPKSCWAPPWLAGLLQPLLWEAAGSSQR